MKATQHRYAPGSSLQFNLEFKYAPIIVPNSFVVGDFDQRGSVLPNGSLTSGGWGVGGGGDGVGCSLKIKC